MEALLHDLDVLIARTEGRLEALKDMYHLFAVHQVEVAELPERLLEREPPIVAKVEQASAEFPGYGADKMARVLESQNGHPIGLPTPLPAAVPIPPPGPKKRQQSFTERRLEVARSILKDGRASAFKLAKRIGVSYMSVRNWTKDCDWFDKDDDSRTLGLTPMGMNEVRKADGLLVDEE